MNDDRQIIEDLIEEKLREKLNLIHSLKLIDLRRKMKVVAREIQLNPVVEIGEKKYELFIEVILDGSPKMLRQTIYNLKEMLRSFPDNTYLYPAIGAPFISNEGIDICREENVGCLDVAGNCYLSFGGVHMETRGNKNSQSKSRTIKFLFSPKSSRIIRVLLSDVHRSWQVQELAKASGISIGLTSRLKRKLCEEDFLTEQGRRVRVTSPEKLIAAWIDNYRYKRNEVKEFYSSIDAPKRENLIAEYCDKRNIRYALGLFSAASRVAPHIRMNKTFIFIDASLNEVANAQNLKVVHSGSNVVLLRPYDIGVLYQSRLIDGLNVVSDVQMYIDLKSYKGRGDEAAEFIMKHSLLPAWRQNRNTESVK